MLKSLINLVEGNKTPIDAYLSKRSVMQPKRVSCKLIRLSLKLYNEALVASRELYRRAVTQHWMF